MSQKRVSSRKDVDRLKSKDDNDQERRLAFSRLEQNRPRTRMDKPHTTLVSERISQERPQPDATSS